MIKVQKATNYRETSTSRKYLKPKTRYDEFVIRDVIEMMEYIQPSTLT